MPESHQKRVYSQRDVTSPYSCCVLDTSDWWLQVTFSRIALIGQLDHVGACSAGLLLWNLKTLLVDVPVSNSIEINGLSGSLKETLTEHINAPVHDGDSQWIITTNDHLHIVRLALQALFYIHTGRRNRSCVAPCDRRCRVSCCL